MLLKNENYISFLENVLDSFPSITLVVDGEGKVQYANNVLLKYLDKNAKDIYQLLAGDVINCVNAGVEGHECGKGPMCSACIIRNTFEDTLFSKVNHERVSGEVSISVNGEQVVMPIQVTSKRLEFEDLELVLLFVEDLSEVKKYQDLLQKKTDFLNSLLNTYPDQFYVVTPDFKLSFINDQLKKQKGPYSPDMHCHEYIYGNKHICNWCIYNKLNKENPKIEYELLDKTNNRIFSINNILLDDHSKLTSRRDITNEIKLKNELYESQRNHERAQEIAKIGHWKFDLIKDKLEWSDQVYQIFELDKRRYEATYPNFLNVIHPKDRKKVNDSYQKAVADKEPYYIEHRLLMKDGRIKFVVEQGETEYDDHGNPLHTLGTVMDVSELKAYERKIVDQNEELKSLSEMKDKFISVLAHDLRSQFSGILGLADVINTDLDKNFEFAEYFRLIHKTIHNSYDLLNNLLDWSKYRLRSQGYSLNQFNLNDAVEKTTELYQISLNQKSLDLRVDIDKNIEIETDIDMFKALLRNLLSNAIKFTPKEGSILVSVVGVENEYVELSVKDNGIGMSKELQKTIFNNSINNSLHGTEGESGSGLGLYICKQFIEKSGGKIWVNSEPQKGSDFHFTVPLKKEGIKPEA